MPPRIERYSQPVLDTVLNGSIKAAEKSDIPTTIAEAKNAYFQRNYGEAVPLFRQIAGIEELQDHRIEAANAYHMLSNCLYFMGHTDDLKEANEAIQKAIEFYPASEEFTGLRTSAVIVQLTILSGLANQTGNPDYFNQGVKVCEQNIDLLRNGQEVQKELILKGFMKKSDSL